MPPDADDPEATGAGSEGQTLASVTQTAHMRQFLEFALSLGGIDLPLTITSRMGSHRRSRIENAAVLSSVLNFRQEERNYAFRDQIHRAFDRYHKDGALPVVGEMKYSVDLRILCVLTGIVHVSSFCFVV